MDSRHSWQSCEWMSRGFSYFLVWLSDVCALAFKPPQNPTNILLVQKSFFKYVPPIYTYLLDPSLCKQIALCARLFNTGSLYFSHIYLLSSADEQGELFELPEQKLSKTRRETWC